MSTYSITATVSQIALTQNKGVISLFNNGAATIYLDAIPGVSPLNGFPLPPLGQISWNSHTPLFAVCATGFTSTLSSTPGASRLDASRSKFWTLLATTNDPNANLSAQFPETISFECGQAETVLLRLDEITVDQGSLSAIVDVVITWQDQLGNTLFTDFLSTVQTNNQIGLFVAGPAVQFFQIPVKGSRATIVFTPQSPGPTWIAIRKISAFGTDRALPFRTWGALENGTTVPLYVTPVTDIASSVFTFDSVAILGAKARAQIVVNTLGKTVQMEVIATGVTTAGFRTITDPTGLHTYASLAVPVGASQVSGTFDIPATGLLLNWLAIVGGTQDITLVWKD